jgi:hypothetical protein
MHAVMVDVLRWAAGDPGTQHERIMRERNHADVVKMPAAQGGAR